MTMQTFNPPMRPSPGAGITPQVSLRKADFGDGYTQAAPAGLNHIRQVITLRWDFLNITEALEIDAFLRAQGGHKPFWYQAHGEAEPRRWTCAEWSITEGTPTRMQATFRESFNTGV